MKKYIWLFTISLVLLSFFTIRDFKSRYTRSINGDAKGYYAYLPAIFIYQDASYGFIDEIEAKYYPEDRSQYKAFKNKQKNGKYVNKCFPGLAIFYLPFFFLAAVSAWLAGIPIDGYSLPFQLGVGLSHVFYFFAGLYLLFIFLKKLNFLEYKIWTGFIFLLFGTNIFYYVIYDHSVSHIFNFFLTTVFIWSIQKWIESKENKWIGIISCILALFVISRPTNAMMILFVPFIFNFCNENVFTFLKSNVKIKYTLKFLPFILLILIIPPVLWKWQSDLWLVYSYNNEGFNFLSPNWLNFLFSFQKGWFLWSPIMLFFFIFSLISFFRKSIYSGLFFFIPFVIITYVLSSWWCWTYGSGMGQRTMIDFYPFILLGTISFFQNSKKINFIILILSPLIILNILQCYQIQKSIHRGGETNTESYWKYFLQWKTIAPSVEIKSNWKLISIKKQIGEQKTGELAPFSNAVISDTLNNIRKIIIDIEIGGKHGDPNLNLVISDSKEKVYRSYNFGDLLYQTPRKMTIAFDVTPDSNVFYKTYVWNSGTNSESVVKKMKVKYYSF